MLEKIVSGAIGVSLLTGCSLSYQVKQPTIKPIISMEERHTIHIYSNGIVEEEIFKRQEKGKMYEEQKFKRKYGLRQELKKKLREQKNKRVRGYRL